MLNAAHCTANMMLINQFRIFALHCSMLQAFFDFFNCVLLKYSVDSYHFCDDKSG